MLKHKSLLIDIALGVSLSLIACIVYFWTICPSVFPGPSAATFLTSVDTIPRFAPAYPLWFWVCDLVNSLVPQSGVLAAMNGISAVCGALAIWALFAVVRESTWLTFKPEQENFVQSQWAARLAGCIAAFTLTFALPYWVMSNRCHWATFHVLLLLLLFRMFLASVQRGSNLIGYLFAFLYGLGCVEYSAMYVFLPIIASAFFWSAHKDERLTPGLLFATLACLAIGILGYLPAAWSFSTTEGAALRGIDTFALSLKTMIADSWNLLAHSLPRQGWIVVLVMTSLPWLVVMGMGRRILNGQADVPVTALQILLLGIVGAVFLNSPISPWVIAGPNQVMLVPYVLSAWTFGILAAFLFVLPRPEWGNMDLESKPIARRVLSLLLVVLLFAFSLWQPARNFKLADARTASGITRLTETLLDQLSGQEWIISDGSMDAQLYLLIRRNGLDVKVMSLAAQGYEPLRKYVHGTLDNPELENRAAIGIDALLQAWMRRPNDAIRELAVMYPRESWIKAGLVAVPQVFFFSGAKNLEDVDLLALKAKHDEAWKAIIPVLNRDVEAEVFSGLMKHIQRNAGRIANELGVLLEDSEHVAEAYDAYRKAREIDPENISALLNAMRILNAGHVAPDTTATTAEHDALVRQLQANRMHIVSIVEQYGTVRESRAVVSMANLNSRTGSDALEISHLEKALDLSRDTYVDSVKLKLAERYFSQGRSEDSEALLQDLLRENPMDRHALLGMFRLMTSRSEFEIAGTFLQRAKLAGVSSQEIILQTVLLSIHKGELDDAQDQLKEFLRDHKKAVRAWEMLIDIQIARRDVKGLERSIYALQAQGQTRGFLMSYASGHLAIMNNDVHDVMRHFEEALLFAPDNLKILQLIAQLDAHQGRLDVAEKRVRTLLRLDPDNHAGNYLMANFQIGRGEYALAKESLNRLLRTKRDPVALNSLAWLLQLAGDTQDAEKTILEAISMNEEIPALWDTYGVILAKSNDKKAAVDAFESALALQADYPAASLNLADQYLDMGETDKALAAVSTLLEQIYDLSPEHRERLRLLQKRLGLE